MSKEAVVVVLDCGRNMNLIANNKGDSYFDLAIETVGWIVSRKVFSESKDEVGLVLFGTSETDNRLAEDNQYQNIKVPRELQLADFEFIKYLQNNIRTSDVDGDFLDALVVALDVMREGVEGKKISKFQIVLISNLGGTIRDQQSYTEIAAGLAKMGIEFNVIGPPQTDSHDDDDDNTDDGGAAGGAASAQNGSQTKIERTTEMDLGEGIMRMILDELKEQGVEDAECYTLAEAMQTLCAFLRRSVRPTPWKCPLEISSTISVPVCLYLKVKENKLKQTWTRLDATRPNAQVKMERIYERMAPVDELTLAQQAGGTQDSQGTQGTADSQNDTQTQTQGQDKFKLPDEDELQVEKEELVKAYRFGKDLVPFSEEDKAKFKFDGSSKSLKLIAFAPKSQVATHLHFGEGVHYVFADENDEAGCIAFSSLVQALMQNTTDEQGVTGTRVAIVRYCYSRAAGPKVGAMIPNVDKKGCEFMMFIPLPFREDVRQFAFPEFPATSEPTKEQNDAFDSLIKSMDLSKAEIDNEGHRVESLNPRKVANPHMQYVFHSLNHRALYPDQPLPKPQDLPQYTATLEPKPELVGLAAPAVEKIKDIFKLEKIEKAETKTAAEMFNKDGDSSAPAAKSSRQSDGASASSNSAAAATTIGSRDPVGDFIKLIDDDFMNFDTALKQMIAMINQFVFITLGSSFYPKAKECIKTMRETCIQYSNTSPFNHFIKDFKEQLGIKSRKDFLNLLADAKLGVISMSECDQSDVTDQAAHEFFSQQVEPTPVPETKQEPEEDVLDEME